LNSNPFINEKKLNVVSQFTGLLMVVVCQCEKEEKRYIFVILALPSFRFKNNICSSRDSADGIECQNKSARSDSIRI
jgi:hypothetical protein